MGEIATRSVVSTTAAKIACVSCLEAVSAMLPSVISAQKAESRMT